MILKKYLCIQINCNACLIIPYKLMFFKPVCFVLFYLKKVRHEACLVKMQYGIKTFMINRWYFDSSSLFSLSCHVKFAWRWLLLFSIGYIRSMYPCCLFLERSIIVLLRWNAFSENLKTCTFQMFHTACRWLFISRQIYLQYNTASFNRNASVSETLKTVWEFSFDIPASCSPRDTSSNIRKKKQQKKTKENN